MQSEPTRYGVMPLDQVLPLSGLEALHAMIAGRLPSPPMAELAGMRLVSAEPGRAAFEGQTDARLLNPFGTVHGGWTCTMLDSAMTCAVLSALPPGRGTTTIELKVNLVRPVLADTGLVRAEGTLIHAGRQIATAEARLVDSGGRLLAHATTTCMILDLNRQAG